MKVERIHATDQIERYRVTGGQRSIVLQTNGPLFKNKGLRHRKGTWKLYEGKDIWNQYALTLIAETIQAHLDTQKDR